MRKIVSVSFFLVWAMSCGAQPGGQGAVCDAEKPCGSDYFCVRQNFSSAGVCERRCSDGFSCARAGLFLKKCCSRGALFDIADVCVSEDTAASGEKCH